MKILLLYFTFSVSSLLFAADPFDNFYYLDPLPNARYINKSSTIIIRPKEDIDINTVKSPGAITITASSSGGKTFTSKTADNNKIVILKPNQQYVYGDLVTVQFTSAIKKTNGTPIEPFSLIFEVTNNNANNNETDNFFNWFIYNESMPEIPTGFQSFTGVPEITVTYSRFPSPGKLFFNNLVRSPQQPNTPCLLIVNNEGEPVFSRQMSDQAYDLNLQPNGVLTYFDDAKGKYYGMDKDYNIIDSFTCGNGYPTDLHELRILPNGNYLIMSYDNRMIDTSFTGMALRSRIIGLIIQEIDVNRDVIFQWRSWDYFNITDATHENLNSGVIDYCHGNAIELDYDGHLMISSRNMDEITKINRITGRTIWRLGGENNQFTFVNDTIGFSHQHAIRRLPNGNVTLYDNGNYHVPPFSRAIEYKLDEVNKTATLVWQYRNSPDIYAPATGYVHRLANNNTIICWGLTNPTLTEVRYDGTKVLEMTLPAGVFSYRAYKYLWNEEPNSEILPAGYSLLQNYPNPFNPSTVIKFTVPKLSTEGSLEIVKLSVYDLRGRLVKVLVNEGFPSGTYSVNYDASATSSGVYFYRAEIGSYSETKKMIFVK